METGSQRSKMLLMFRDWVTNADNTYSRLRHRRWADPFPNHGGASEIIGMETAPTDPGSQTGRLPDAVTACVGGGSNAIGLFHVFWTTPVCGWSDSKPTMVSRRTRGDIHRRFAGAFQGSFSYLLQDEDGQTIESHLICSWAWVPNMPGSGKPESSGSSPM